MRIESELIRQRDAIGLLGRSSIAQFASLAGAWAERLGGDRELRELPALPRPRDEARLDEVGVRLAALAVLLEGMTPSPIARLLGLRVDELELERRIVRQWVAGHRTAPARDPEVQRLARLRYASTSDEADEADALAERWLDEDPPGPESTPGSDRSLRPLAAWFSSFSRQEGLEFRVVEAELNTVAAVGGEQVFVQRDRYCEKAEATRIWWHEVHGHLLPRLEARRSPPPLRVGTHGSNEDEEGRALLLEERAGLLGRARRRELALRHELARAVLDPACTDADLLSTARRFVRQRGFAALDVARALLRSLRAGGLGREVVYLPAFVRVRAHFAARPSDEAWMRAGCTALCALPELRSAYGDAPREALGTARLVQSPQSFS